MRRTTICAIPVLLTLASHAYPQTTNTMAAPGAGASPRATLTDVRWLVGSWEGTGLGGTCTESGPQLPGAR